MVRSLTKVTSLTDGRKRNLMRYSYGLAEMFAFVFSFAHVHLIWFIYLVGRIARDEKTDCKETTVSTCSHTVGPAYGLFTLVDPDSDPYWDSDSCTVQKFHIGSDSDSDPLIEMYVVGTEICP